MMCIEREIKELDAHQKSPANLPVHIRRCWWTASWVWRVSCAVSPSGSVGTCSPFGKCLEHFVTSETPVVDVLGMVWHGVCIYIYYISNGWVLFTWTVSLLVSVEREILKDPLLHRLQLCDNLKFLPTFSGNIFPHGCCRVHAALISTRKILVVQVRSTNLSTLSKSIQQLAK